ncbi:MAG TPA: SDR family NAD(P)-dependent oxidoreductase [Mycobacteriales bacterium]|nr:SDR family NAD(P)-dependent oxidoreductase [Mycobacteriales bacterium]
MTTILITGATDGLGRALAGRLAGPGTTLLLHGRDQAKLDAVAGGARTFRADFSALEEVRALAAAVLDSTDRIDVLVNNAGIGSGLPVGRSRAESRDGFELRFAVNYLAPFLLTQSLLPVLRAAAPARIVHVASLGQHPLDFGDLMLERDYSGSRAYRQSKLAQIISGFELASRLPAAEVTVNCVHPGTHMPTKMVLEEHGGSEDALEIGVASILRAIGDPERAGVTGRFYDRQREARADAQAYDPAVRASLWSRSLEITGAPDVAQS